MRKAKKKFAEKKVRSHSVKLARVWAPLQIPLPGPDISQQDGFRSTFAYMWLSSSPHIYQMTVIDLRESSLSDEIDMFCFPHLFLIVSH